MGSVWVLEMWGHGAPWGYEGLGWRCRRYGDKGDTGSMGDVG